MSILQSHQEGACWLTWQRGQTQVAFLCDGHHFVLLLATATVGYCQSRGCLGQKGQPE